MNIGSRKQHTNEWLPTLGDSIYAVFAATVNESKNRA